MTSSSFEHTRTLLRDSVSDNLGDIGRDAVCSAIQALVWQRGDLAFEQTTGWAELEPVRPLHPDTQMDIASLTKALVTATLTMRAVDEGYFCMDTPLVDLLPGWDTGDSERRQATVLHLLNHSSGLPAWDKFYLQYPIDPPPETAIKTREALFRDIQKRPLEAPPGERHTYSDLGYILLAHILERAYGDLLHVPAQRLIFDALDMEHTDYVARIAGDSPIETAAATEICPLRRRTVVGTVHDENTDIMGGVSGHAGVFSTARDLSRFLAHMLGVFTGRIDDGVVSSDILKFCWSDAARGANGHHLGGWDTPSGEVSSAGRGFQSSRTVGHLGFTGTSFWIDLERELFAVLLTNRVYPTRENATIKALRVGFHELIHPASDG
ncbi:MAG: serine hydrolase domain-containing protein [Myxococcota bacterium]